MAENDTEKSQNCKSKKCSSSSGNSAGGMGGFTYFLFFLGALIFYIQQSGSFWEYVIAVLKALVWPAFLIYQVLTFINT